MIALYQKKAIRQLEQRCFDEQWLSPHDLMLRAAESAWSYFQCRYRGSNKITVFCGKGNNAGDGLVFARLAADAGLQVRAVLLFDPELMSTESRNALKSLSGSSVVFENFSLTTKCKSGVIVDAILGIGLKGETSHYLSGVIDYINSTGLPVLSLDIPSGLHANTGRASVSTIKADATVTFIAMKTGLVTCNGLEYCGSICVNDLGLPIQWLADVEPTAQTLLWNDVVPLLKRRQRDVHKGNHGHALVIGGDYGMGGAVRMSAEAALRVGAGLVTVATRPEHVSIVTGVRPEIMCHQVANSDDLDCLIDRCDVIVIGPGLGTSNWASQLLESVLLSPKPKVLDADALNLLSNRQCSLLDAIITPHPGEAARLLSMSSIDVQDDRFAAMTSLLESYQSVVVLKGSGTLVASEGLLPFVCTEGNPGMASAGMGDVLTGVLGGLLAQGLTTIEAAKAGVLVHSVAADRAAEEGGERGLLATDLLNYLRTLVNPYDLC